MWVLSGHSCLLDTCTWVVGICQDLWFRRDTKKHTGNGRVGQQSRREDFGQNRSRSNRFQVQTVASWYFLFLHYQFKVCSMGIFLKGSTVCVKYWTWIGFFSIPTGPFVTSGRVSPFIGLHAQKISNILSSIAHTFGRACVIKSQREGESSQWPLPTFASKFDFDTWNDNLYDTWFHPTVKIVYGVRCAHNRVKHFISESHVGSNFILAPQAVN